MLHIIFLSYNQIMQYEIEIKSLLGDKKAADAFVETLATADPTATIVSRQKQLNHYFKSGKLDNLIVAARPYLAKEQLEHIRDIAKRANSINVRTRQRNDEVLLIVKGSLDHASAAHSHQRMEFEEVVDLTIDELDTIVLQSGWELEAKWQAERTIYSALGLTIDMIKTPGYGYMVEFEKVVSSDTSRDAAHQLVVDVMETLGAKELPNDRLERMFAYYNQHWQEYYGTDNVFVVE